MFCFDVFRWNRTGSSLPWWLTGCFCGSSQRRAWSERLESSFRRRRCTTAGSPSPSHSHYETLYEYMYWCKAADYCALVQATEHGRCEFMPDTGSPAEDTVANLQWRWSGVLYIKQLNPVWLYFKVVDFSVFIFFVVVQVMYILIHLHRHARA